jgi:hypothetical protein
MKKLIYLVLVVFIAFVAGCGKTDVKTDSKTDTKTEGIDVKTKDVDVSTNKLPADWPTDIPVYKDAKLLASAKTPQGSTATYEISDKLKPVGDFYKDGMKKAGYDPDKSNEMMMTDKGGVMIYKKSGKEVDITMGYADATSKTSVVVLVK